MLVIALDQSEPPAEEGDASRGIDQPAAAQLADFVAALNRQLVVEIGQLDVARLRWTQQLRSFTYRGSQQVLIQHIAPELKRGHGTAQKSACFRCVGVAGHLVIAEPVTKPFFRQMFGLEVVPHRQPARQEHGRHFRRGLAHFGVEGLGFFDDEDAKPRMIAPQQNRRRRAAERATKDDHIVAIGLHRAIVTLAFRLGLRAL